MEASSKDHFVTTITDDLERNCWGCGSRLLLPSYAPIFKCSWCGAITNPKISKPEVKCFRWRRLRDRCFVCILVVFMLFVICGGVWSAYPVLFSVSYLCGVFNSFLAACLAISTLSTFSLAAYKCAGTPPSIIWGSYPAVQKRHLENYTFCDHCCKPKSPRAHHCSSCGTCILDMDHHCPFIGNCVGAANHRHFICFLMSAVISTIYVAIISAYTGLHIWPPLPYKSRLPIYSSSSRSSFAWIAMKEIISALFGSAMLLSARGVLLVYLFVSSVSVNIGLSVLLWQQLYYIYAGKTYLDHLITRNSDNSDADSDAGKSWRNLPQFFGFSYPVFRYLPSTRGPQKKHKT